MSREAVSKDYRLPRLARTNKGADELAFEFLRDLVYLVKIPPERGVPAAQRGFDGRVRQVLFLNRIIEVGIYRITGILPREAVAAAGIACARINPRCNLSILLPDNFFNLCVLIGVMTFLLGAPKRGQ